MERNEILLLANRIEKQLKHFRHELHKRAELSMQEFKTASYIRSVLTENDIEFKEVGTGTIVDINNNLKGSVLALRADIDALPITEPKTFEFHSENEGCMHACGHDCHTAILLATAIITKENESALTRPVRFIFQPAEERIGGATSMINAGCLEDVTEIYCLHMQPHRPIGVFATKAGCIHASSDGFVIKVNGKNAPGAYPNKGVDAIWVSSQIVIALQGLISRETSAFQNAVLTIGKIEGGEARNIICNKVVMDGTLRSTNKEHRQKLINRINQIVNSIAIANGATAEFEIIQSYISGFNDDYCTQKAIGLITFLFGKENIQIQSNPSMGGEDFSFYQEKVSGCKLVLGTGTSENLHTSAFYVNEDTLKYGVGFYLGLIFLN